jgi:hypothetical protein
VCVLPSSQSVQTKRGGGLYNMCGPSSKEFLFWCFFSDHTQKNKGKKTRVLFFFCSYVFKDSLFIALLEWEKRGKKGTFEDGKKNPKTLRFSGGGVVNFFGGLINIIYICF